MRILNFGITATTNGQHFSFIEAVLNRAKGDTKIMAQFPQQVTNLQTAFDNEDFVMLKHSQKPLTLKIQKADGERGSILSLVNANFREFRYFPDPEKQAAAELLYTVVRDYGDIRNKKYDDQTGLLTNLCQDLTGRYAPEVRTLGQTENVAALEAANNRFKELMAERTENVSHQPNGEMLAVRQRTDEAYYDLRDVINGTANVDPEHPQFQDFIAYVNAEIRRYQVSMGQTTNRPDTGEGGNGDNGGETDDNETNPPTENDPNNPTDPTPGEGDGEGGGSDNNGNEGGNDNAEENDDDYDDPPILS